MYTKIILYVAIAFGSFSAGMFTQSKLTKEVVVKCPELPAFIHKCPTSTSIQQLDMSAIRKIKGDFTYTPNFNAENLYIIQGNDTIKQIKNK